MELRRLDRQNLSRGFGLDYELLLPWPALNAPFEGALCVLRPGDASDAHAHHEYEIFIAMKGRAAVVAGDERAEFRAGDIVHLPPHVEHSVVNDGDETFEYYAIWWDTDMSARFVVRHEEVTSRV